MQTFVLRAIAFGLCACSATEGPASVAGAVEGGARDAQAAIEVGRAWPSPVAGETIAVVDGRFRAPADIGVARAFVDVDGDGHGAAFLEPSAHCRLVSHAWSCVLPASRVTAHRVRNHRFRGGAAELVADDLVVTGEAFDTYGAPRPTSLCLAGHDDICAQAGGHAFIEVAPAVESLSACATRGALPPDQPFTMKFEVHEEEATFVDVVYPPVLDASVRATWDRNDLTLHIALERPVSQIISWYGSEQLGEIVWSTEHEPDRLTWTTTGAAVRIPRRVIDQCSGCRLLLQMVEVREQPGTLLLSEDRFTILDRQP